MKKQQHLINREIRATEVRVDGKIMRFTEALAQAESQELDLVLVAPNAIPPVCKIMSYEKYLYELGKKEKDKPKSLEVKEIKIGPNTSENDLTYRVKHIIDFLKKGHKVRITMQFKGREVTYVSNGEALILKLVLDVEEFGVAEAMPKLEGKKMSVIIRPKSNK
jgi:translation initiation factor IF-3